MADAREAAWRQQWQIVRGIAASIATERSRGNEAGVSALRPFFDSNVQKLRQLTAGLDGADLTALDRWILSMEAGARQLPPLPFLPKPDDWVPLVWGAAVVLALIYFGPAIARAVKPLKRSGQP